MRGKKIRCSLKSVYENLSKSPFTIRSSRNQFFLLMYDRLFVTIALTYKPIIDADCNTSPLSDRRDIIVNIELALTHFIVFVISDYLYFWN